jgi:hypothetical protein
MGSQPRPVGMGEIRWKSGRVVAGVGEANRTVRRLHQRTPSRDPRINTSLGTHRGLAPIGKAYTALGGRHSSVRSTAGVRH